MAEPDVDAPDILGWGIYPMDGMFHVTRHRRPHEKDQEYRGSFQTEEQAKEQIALLERDARVRELLEDWENPDLTHFGEGSPGPLFNMGMSAQFDICLRSLREAVAPSASQSTHRLSPERKGPEVGGDISMSSSTASAAAPVGGPPTRP